eukprot:458870-Pyramimonas_sp.AAC.1
MSGEDRGEKWSRADGARRSARAAKERGVMELTGMGMIGKELGGTRGAAKWEEREGATRSTMERNDANERERVGRMGRSGLKLGARRRKERSGEEWATVGRSADGRRGLE